MSTSRLVEFDEDHVQVDAVLVAGSLGLEPEAFMARLREGQVTGLFERGIDEHAGQYRLTFFFESRRVRLIVDDCGRVLQRVSHDYSPEFKE